MNKQADGAGALPSERNQHLPFAPCNGPDCSADPLSPAIPFELPVSNSTGVKSSAARDEVNRDFAKESSWGPAIANDEGPVRRDDSIFHPPRR
jgi:hypothetical protein